jgi:cyclin D6
MATEEWALPDEEDAAYDYEFEFDLENPFTSPADEPIASLLDAEAHHAPSVSAAASAARRDAVAFISKVRGRPPRAAAFALAALWLLCLGFPLFLDPIGLDRSRCDSAASSPCTRASPTSRSTTWIASSPSGNWR